MRFSRDVGELEVRVAATCPYDIVRAGGLDCFSRPKVGCSHRTSLCSSQSHPCSMGLAYMARLLTFERHFLSTRGGVTEVDWSAE